MDFNNLLSVATFSPKRLQYPNSWIGHLPFAVWLIKQINPKIFVELGTHSGNSYFSFCQAVKEENLRTNCYAVDTWKGDEHAGFYGEEIFLEVNSYNQIEYGKFSNLIRMTFDEAISCFSNKSIDLLHLDGHHTYEAVKHDFETWLPKLADDAVILFHDTNVRERDFGVWKFWKEIQEISPLSLEFKHSYGLGVIQLNNTKAKTKLDWLIPNGVEQKLLKEYFWSLGTRQIERFELNKQLVENKVQILNLNQFITERDLIINDLRKFVSDRDSIIIDLKKFVSDRDSIIKQLEQNLLNHTSIIDEFRVSLLDYDTTVKNLNQDISNRDSIINEFKKSLSENKSTIINLNQTVSDKDLVINDLKNLLFLNEQQLLRNQENALAQQDLIIHNFHNSRTWRLTAPFRHLANLLRPFQNKLRKSQNIKSEMIASSNDFEWISKQVPNSDELEQNKMPNVFAFAKQYKLTNQSIVLFVTHSLGGEVENNLQKLSQFLTENEFRVLILRPHKQNTVSLESFGDNDSKFTLNTNDLEVLAENINSFGIKKIHIHHTAGFDFSIEELLLLMQVPYDFTIYNDFLIHLEKDSTQLNYEVLNSNNSNEKNFVVDYTIDSSDIYWKNLKFISLLNGAERIICPTQEIADRVAKICPSSSLIKVPHQQSQESGNISRNNLKNNEISVNHFYKSSQYWTNENKEKSLPTLVLIPEMYGAIPSACSYIRLIKPILLNDIQNLFKLRISNLKNFPQLSPDIIVTNRLPFNKLSDLEPFLKHIKRTGAKLIYDLDDNLLCLGENHPENEYYKSKELIIQKLLKEANLVWTSTKNLALHLQPYCQKIEIIENYLDENLLETKVEKDFSTDKFRILYMGTSSHQKDLVQVLSSLKKLVDRGLKIELNLIGINFNNLSEKWINVISPPAKTHHYPNFMKWLKSLDCFDLGIAPLENSTFDNCKSDIKFWDYTAMGLPVLASNSEAYHLIIKDGKNGLLANNSTDSWIEKITWAMNNRNQLKDLVTNAINDLKVLSVKRSANFKRQSFLLYESELQQTHINLKTNNDLTKQQGEK